jgi:uncharacterized RDD family membrane protein YckC
MTTAGPSGPRATFGQRFVAWLIDAIIIGVVSGILSFGGRSTIGSILGTLVGIAYFVYLEGSPSGQTVGKRAMSIRVVGFNTGTSIEYSGAFIRAIGKWVSGLVCALGYFWMLWDPEKQTWHDKIATTAVVPVEYYPVEKWPG